MHVCAYLPAHTAVVIAVFPLTEEQTDWRSDSDQHPQNTSWEAGLVLEQTSL